MCPEYEQIWHSGEYHLFPTGMHCAEGELLRGLSSYNQTIKGKNRDSSHSIHSIEE